MAWSLTSRSAPATAIGRPKEIHSGKSLVAAFCPGKVAAYRHPLPDFGHTTRACAAMRIKDTLGTEDADTSDSVTAHFGFRRFYRRGVAIRGYLTRPVGVGAPLWPVAVCACNNGCALVWLDGRVDCRNRGGRHLLPGALAICGHSNLGSERGSPCLPD